MTLKVIKTEEDYKNALQRLSILSRQDLTQNNKRKNEVEVLQFLIKSYELNALKLIECSAIEAVKIRMNQVGLNQNDMEFYLGSKAKTSEVLNGKINFSMSMIRKLVNGLEVPAECFLRDNDLKNALKNY